MTQWTGSTPPATDAAPTGMVTPTAWPPASAKKGASAYQVIRLIACVIAAALFGLAGLQMTSIQSQAGNTINEAFYQGVGVLSYGLAVLSLALAFPNTREG